MNIFVLDENPYLAAQYHNNKHVVKMILETAQLLSTAHHVLDGEGCQIKDLIYKKTHTNHPCAKWVRESDMNYWWTYNLLRCLLQEYTFRYGKVHATSRILDTLFKNPRNIHYGPMTTHPQCMPDDCKSDDIVKSYRNYYIKYKNSTAQWKNRNTPDWYKI